MPWRGQAVHHSQEWKDQEKEGLPQPHPYDEDYQTEAELEEGSLHRPEGRETDQAVIAVRVRAPINFLGPSRNEDATRGIRHEPIKSCGDDSILKERLFTLSRLKEMLSKKDIRLSACSRSQ